MLSKVVKFGVVTACTLAPTVVAQPGHTGVYLGAEGGASLWRFKFKTDEQNTFSFEEDGSFVNKATGRVGGFVGAGKAFNSGVYIGAQIGAGAALGPLKSEITGGKIELKPGYYYSADVRLGYAMSPGCLVYVSGGFEGQAVKFTAEFALPSFTIEMGKDDRTHVPYGTVGLGLRYQFSNGLFVGCEAKAMFGAKTTWKIKMPEETATKVDQEITNFTEIKKKIEAESYTGADLQNAFTMAQKYGCFEGCTLEGTGVKKNGATLSQDQVDSLLSEALDKMGKLLGGFIILKDVDRGFKQKTRLQNYAFTVSIGYRF